MKEKQIKINIPEGYEIDKENSTFELIKFKPIVKALPKSWEELKVIDGYYVDVNCNVRLIKSMPVKCTNRNIFRTKEQAKASIALAELSHAREIYRQGWLPNWDTMEDKWCIVKKEDTIVVTDFVNTNFFLSFETKKIAQEFLDNFKDTIKEASPLLF